MNWFERHFNWTTLGIVVGSVLVFEVATRVSLGFNNILVERCIELNLPLFIWLSVLIYMCFALSVIGYGWVLHRKNRSPWFLSFYFIIAVLCLTIFFYQAMCPQYVPWSITFPFIYFSIIFVFTVGWIVLLSLKNHNHTLGTGLLHRIYTSGTLLRNAVFSIAGIVITVSIFSVCYISFGSFHFDTSDLNTPDLPGFSFDYPVHYNKPYLNPEMQVFIVIDEQLITFERVSLKEALIHCAYSWIDIEIYPEHVTNTLRHEHKSFKEWLIFDKFRPFGDFDSQIVDTTTAIDGIPARQLFLSVYKPPGTMSNWGTITSVYFERDDCLWVISWKTWDEAADQPPPYFTHLLETFKIQ